MAFSPYAPFEPFRSQGDQVGFLKSELASLPEHLSKCFKMTVCFRWLLLSQPHLLLSRGDGFTTAPGSSRVFSGLIKIFLEWMVSPGKRTKSALLYSLISVAREVHLLSRMLSLIQGASKLSNHSGTASVTGHSSRPTTLQVRLFGRRARGGTSQVNFLLCFGQPGSTKRTLGSVYYEQPLTLHQRVPVVINTP